MSDVSEDEDFSQSDAVYKPSFVLIAIDTDPSMFLKKESDEPTPFKACISACYELANSLIFTQSKRSWSPFGIVLGLEDSSASFVNFDENILNSIKFLKEKDSLTEDKLCALYQRKGSFDLSAFFLFCKKKFKDIKSAFYKRTIIYITNDDNPIKGDKTQRFAALNEAKNFEANDINFQMVTMNNNFDYKVFYNELFSVMKEPLVETLIEDEEGLLEKLSSLILVRYYQRRFNFFPIQGDHSRFLKLTQKNFIQEQKLYNNAFITSDGKPVKKVSKKSDEPPVYTLNFGAARGGQEFDVQENFELKHNNLPIGYTLLHVSNRVTEVGLVLTNPAILELNYKENLNFFNSFWQYCVDKDKVLVCVRKIKHNDKIRFVELIPKFANNAKIFVVKTIPFISEINHPPSSLAVKEEQASVHDIEAEEVTNNLIDTLTFDYHPKMFINPSFAKKKAFLISKFLDEPLEDVEDVTLDNSSIDDQLGEVADKFNSLFQLGKDAGSSRKRRTPAASERSKRKK